MVVVVGGSSRASTHGAVHKWFPEDKYRTTIQEYGNTRAGTNCVFRLHWWYLLVVGSCIAV